MTDPHLNLFWAFGHKGDARQLEDNVTRALVVTLKHLGDAATATALGRLGIFDVPEGRWGYHLHRPPPGVGSHRKVLLGIAPGAVAFTDDTRPSTTDGSVLDASLVVEGLHVGVETKITGDLDAGQIVRHLRGLGYEITADQLAAGVPCVVRRTWGEVADAVAEVGKDDPVASAFSDYLHLLGLSPFRGFTGLDTVAWNAWSDPLSQDFLRNRLVALGDAVQAARPDLFGPGGLVPIRNAADGPRSHAARGEFSLRWALDSPSGGGDAVTANLFIEPAAGPLSDGALPTLGLSLFMGRSYRVAEAVVAHHLAFFDDLHSPMFLGGPDSFVFRVDRWERGPGGSRWNNAKVNNDGGEGRAWREWSVRQLMIPPYPDWASEVRALIDASVSPNERQYSPSLSFCKEWNSPEHRAVLGSVGLVEEVAAQLDRVRLAMGSVRAFLRGQPGDIEDDR